MFDNNDSEVAKTKVRIGLDLGPNSIGWAVVKQNESGELEKLLASGVRILPMSKDDLNKFESGKAIETAAKQRRMMRGARRMHQRFQLRRTRLHRILGAIGYLPEHYASQIDWERHPGDFKFDVQSVVSSDPMATTHLLGAASPRLQPKLAYRKDDSGFQFLFMREFEEMVAFFKAHNPEAFDSGTPRAIPLDWTIYYLRQKALREQVSKEALAWIILQFNQKRGYVKTRSLSGDDSEENKDLREYRVSKITENPNKGNKGRSYTLFLVDDDGNEVGEAKRVKHEALPKGLNTKLCFIVKEVEGKGGEPVRTFSIPNETNDAWVLRKLRTESKLKGSESGEPLTPGQFIFERLLRFPDHVVGSNDGAIAAIDRHFYREELLQILRQQAHYYPELLAHPSEELLLSLYKRNEAHRNSLLKRSLIDVIVDDALFYHRPLRSKRHLISKCPYEEVVYLDGKGNPKKQKRKVIPRSHPVYEEYRLRKFIRDLSFIDVDGKKIEPERGKLILPIAYQNELYYRLHDRKEVSNAAIVSSLKAMHKEHKSSVGLAGVSTYLKKMGDKKVPVCPTRFLITKALEGAGGTLEDFEIVERHMEPLWHLLHTIHDQAELERALRTFARKRGISNISRFAEELSKTAAFPLDYGNYSVKAIKKLLPLMRSGSDWSWETIDAATKERIEKIRTGEADESIANIVRESVEKELGLEPERGAFQGLPEWLACYIVYDRHAEAVETKSLRKVEDLNEFIRDFRSYDLRNPIVQKVVGETLLVVRDLMMEYDIRDIAIELGRELKNSAKEREKITKMQLDNQKRNRKENDLLEELLRASAGKSAKRKVLPSYAMREKFRLYVEQGGRSPYSGRKISLSALLDPKDSSYEREHIIPRAVYYDDSFNNKVLVESELNGVKGKELALPFIRSKQAAHLGAFSDVDEYIAFVNDLFAKNKSKRERLLAEEVPDDFTSRQLNDTRYISRMLMGILSNIVREEGEEEATSKHLLPVNGKITNALKEEWGLKEVWDAIVRPRYEALNKVFETDVFGYWDSDESGRKFFRFPKPNEKGNNIRKRIDHRHHALDAIAIACATRGMLQYFNNENACSGGLSYQNLKQSLFEEVERRGCEGKTKKRLRKPWLTFTQDSKAAIRAIIPSFKNGQRVLERASNSYFKYVEHVDAEGNKVWRKERVRQAHGGKHWSVRHSLHKETIYGKRDPQGMRLEPDFKFDQRTQNVVSSRKGLVDYFTEGMSKPKEMDEKALRKELIRIADKEIRDILTCYFDRYQSEREKKSFTKEDEERLNANIVELNKNRWHAPIKKITSIQAGTHSELSQQGENRKKLIETGGILVTGVYQSETGRRRFLAVPVDEVVRNRVEGNNPLPFVLKEKTETYQFQFALQYNDLVYFPAEEELARSVTIEDITTSIAKGRDCLYRFTSSSKQSQNVYFTPVSLAEVVRTPKNKMVDEFDIPRQYSQDLSRRGTMIKDVCVKVNLDRLGRIKSIEQ